MLAARSAPLRAWLVTGACLLSGVGVPAFADRRAGEQWIEQARAALRRGDGIDAEAKLRAALAAGVPAKDVNAWMGQAYVAQDNPAKAREWLEGGEFSRASAEAGWRALGLLEMNADNQPAAGRAYDRALALAPRDAGLWVDIGVFRERSGQYALASAAADRALSLDGHNVRALDFKGRIERDRLGMARALQWFERALERDPDDVQTLLDQAATLGEMGRAGACLTITRRVLHLDPGNAMAYYLQAVMAARAGRYALARRLLARTGGKLDTLPGVRMLGGILELSAGNPSTAAEAFEGVLRDRPDTRHALDLLARAIYLSGEYRYATLRFSRDIQDGTASPYILTVVARAHEMLGERWQAGILLDRAAAPPPVLAVHVRAAEPRVGALLSSGDGAAAETVARTDLASQPGGYFSLSRAGDVQLARGRPAAALPFYEAAARVRYPESLFRRRLAAYIMAGNPDGADRLVGHYLGGHPASRGVVEAAAQLALERGRFGSARSWFAWLYRTGSARSVGTLAALSMAQWQTGDASAAERSAAELYRLQRASPLASAALAYSYARAGKEGRAQVLSERTRMLAQPSPPAALDATADVGSGGTEPG